MPSERTKIELSLMLMITTLGRSYRRILNRLLAGHGLSDAQALPVIFIARLGEGVRQGTLADQLNIEGPSLVRQLDQLCAAGLVERRFDPSDRRAKGLYLTESGRELACKIEALFGKCRSRLLVGIDDQDLAAAHKVLSHLTVNIDLALISGDIPGQG